MSLGPVVNVAESIVEQPAQLAPVPVKKENFFDVVFHNLGHFFAKFAKINSAVQAEEPAVESVEAAIPGGAVLEPITDVAFAVFGDIAAAITSGGAAAEAKLADAGLDTQTVAKVKTALADSKDVVALGKALFKPTKTAAPKA